MVGQVFSVLASVATFIKQVFGKKEFIHEPVSVAATAPPVVSDPLAIRGSEALKPIDNTKWEQHRNGNKILKAECKNYTACYYETKMEVKIFKTISRRNGTVEVIELSSFIAPCDLEHLNRYVKTAAGRQY
ncbi:hypothetical protein BSK65_10705 [Paenibacillus odorifer]|uniref:Uncharacterized protein n=1 Tax=Paenibacillus odorifer TaxID=189426 RepID=A0A1R0ZJY4_9BACL|nr:hypothetical protein [Paenibacillus odorifer]OME71502.1 hypothetical protein BSK65_10705 [Paenibacillus odorifer]